MAATTTKGGRTPPTTRSPGEREEEETVGRSYDDRWRMEPYDAEIDEAPTGGAEDCTGDGDHGGEHHGREALDGA